MILVLFGFKWRRVPVASLTCPRPVGRRARSMARPSTPGDGRSGRCAHEAQLPSVTHRDARSASAPSVEAGVRSRGALLRRYAASTPFACAHRWDVTKVEVKGTADRATPLRSAARRVGPSPLNTERPPSLFLDHFPAARQQAVTSSGHSPGDMP